MTTNTSKSGFSLVEMAFAIVLTGILMGSVGVVMKTTTGAFEEGRMENELDSRAQRVLDRIARQFSEADLGNLDPEPDPDFGASTLTFRHSEGVLGSVVQWSALMNISLELEDGESDDGADNNGNGLIDESRVVWTENPGLPSERRVVWAHGIRESLEGEIPNNAVDDNDNGIIDEGGLVFALEGETLVVWLTLEQAVEGGRLRTKTVSTSVRVRN